MYSYMSMSSRGETNIEFRVRTNSCRNERTRTNVLSRLSKTNIAWHTSYVCTLQLANTSNSRKSKFSSVGRSRFLPPASFSNFFFFFFFFFFLQHSLEWLHHACLFHAARRSMEYGDSARRSMVTLHVDLW